MSKKKNLKFKPNPIFSSYWFSKFENKFMQRGRQASVEKAISKVFRNIKVKYHRNALKILFLALQKNRPLLSFAEIRVGREIKEVPIPLSARRQLVVALDLFVHAAKREFVHEGNLTMEKVLYTHLEAILQNKKTLLTQWRIDHAKELIENRVNLRFRKRIKK